MVTLLKALIKFSARTLNDSILGHDIKNAHSKSYAKTGKQLRKARYRGYYVNGSKTYRQNYQKSVATAKQRHNNREKFISDL